MNNIELGSIAGVIALTMMIVSMVKAWLSETPYVRKIPIIVVAVFVACGLTALAHAAGYMTGSLGQGIAKTIIAAFSSSGLYSMLTGSSTQTVKDTAQEGIPRDISQNRVLPLLLLLAFMPGCANQQQFVYNAKVGYHEFLSQLADSRDSGQIAQSVIDDTAPYRKAVRSALDQWEVASKTGNVDKIKLAKTAFDLAYDVLKQEVAKRGGKHVGTNTAPSSRSDSESDRRNRSWNRGESQPHPDRMGWYQQYA